ncbi:hypothetical protein SBI_06040 [Streptomyces bingchenggensis BCW-1]|uniref:Uncharacterized protein n=2 Tax=Streptomyces TaxID=1883 RepID=D7CHW0_STRBB|nr:hypothetical protein SBI_06040 [Streptomyces bingchenggensis BCW-1]
MRADRPRKTTHAARKASSVVRKTSAAARKNPLVLGVVALTAVAALLTTVLALRGSGEDGTTTPKAGIDLERRITDYTARFGADTGYLEPKRADRQAVARAVGLLLDGHRDQAAARLDALDFDLRTITDSATGRRYAEIADRTDTGPTPRGWGRVYVDLSAPAHWSVQIPHPVADARTEQLGVGILRGSPGGVLVLAGAHRDAGVGDAADVAHRRYTVFAAVCAELAERGLPGIQIHGFADDSAPDYDVIASTGRATRESRADARTLANALRARDFEVCRAWVRSCPLEGRTNEQGRAAAAQDSTFLHVEFANAIRTDRREAARAVAAVNVVTARWAKRTPHPGATG